MPNELKEIDVRNYRAIRRAHLVFEGNTIVISGDNATGKTSFLNAIESLFGGKDHQPPVPVRKGSKEATIIGFLQCADGRKLKATVTINAATNQRRVVVVDEENKPQSSPQAVLDAFWANTSFDPTLFLVSKADEQDRMLKKLAGLDFTAIDAEKAKFFTTRTGVNGELDRLRARVSAMKQFPDAPAAEESAAAISKQLEEAIAENASIDKLADGLVSMKGNLLKAKDAHTKIGDEIKEIDIEILRLQNERKTMVSEQEAQVKAIAVVEADVTGCQAKFDLLKPIDLTPIRSSMATVEERNQKVRANAARATALADLKAKEKESSDLTDRIEGVNERREEMLQKAKYPVVGLAVSEQGVLFNGLPLEQASDSQKIAIGIRMAAAMNPGKSIILVRNGNFFTDKNFPLLNQIAEELGLTVVVEVAGPRRKDSALIFEDGIGYLPGEEGQQASADPAKPAEPGSLNLGQ